jgi:phenylacetate-CoA ligase
MIEAFPTRAQIVETQLRQLRGLLSAVHEGNAFYRRKLDGVTGSQIVNLSDFAERVPFTVKKELAEDQATHPPYGSNLTFPLERYTRFHQTSGTSGAPLRWLDTPESWQWMVENWKEVFHAAEVGSNDRICFAFSFGPFIGFWLAFEAGTQLGALCLPGGGLSSAARLRLIFDSAATVLCCTPTYALRLAEVAAQENLDLSRAPLRRIIVAGEPGGSIPATRSRIERLWPGARVFDHHGMTEIGPVTYECPARPGFLHVMESAFIPEVIDPETGRAADAGAGGELVLTNLGRTASPLFRYRTGDLVKAVISNAACQCGRHDLALDGGVIGRADDMVIVRGVNVHPSGVESILRRFPEVAEFEAEVSQAQALAELSLRIEPVAGCPDTNELVRRIGQEFQNHLNLRIPVLVVPPGTLPRFEMKSRRWVRRE